MPGGSLSIFRIRVRPPSPVFVQDLRGRLHALWLDAFDGIVYASTSGSRWSTPQALELPFSTRRYSPTLRDEENTPSYIPKLLPGREGQIFAFWQDDEGSLFSSLAAGDEFEIFESWSERQELSPSVIDFDVPTGSEGSVQLVFQKSLTRTNLQPAFITAAGMKTRVCGQSQSPYLRACTTASWNRGTHIWFLRQA